MTEIQTVTGTITPDRLGRTLMHEHLLVGYPGSDVDWVHPGPSRRERVQRCVDRIEEMKGLGFTALLDPCPSDLGRDVELMAEVAQRTHFQLICATGLYKEAEGAAAYWKFKMNFGSVVEANEIIAVPAGRFPSSRIRIVSALLGPNDAVHVWFSRSGTLALRYHLETQVTDVDGNIIGTETFDYDETLQDLSLVGS